jgi:hypothetical protein
MYGSAERSAVCLQNQSIVHILQPSFRSCNDSVAAYMLYLVVLPIEHVYGVLC